MKKIMCFILILIMLASAVSCGGDDSTTTTDLPPIDDDEIPVVHPEYEISSLVDNTRFSSLDNYIGTYSENSYAIKENYDISSGSVEIKEAGAYRITGSTDKYIIKVQLSDGASDNKVVIILDNVNVMGENQSQKSAVIYSENADLTIVLAKDSVNNLTGYANCLHNGVIAVRRGSLTIEGSGKLNIKSPDYMNGIHCTKKISVIGGSLNIDSGNHCIYGKEGVTVLNGDLTLNAKRFGIKSGDSPSESNPENVVGHMNIYGGAIKVNAGDNGLDINGILTVYGAGLDITSTRNAIKANDDIKVGDRAKNTLILLNSGTDGLDSDKNIEITGKTNIKIYSKGDGIVSLNSTIDISGQIFITTRSEYVESVIGDYILRGDKYIKINPLDYPNETYYDLLLSCKGIKATEDIIIKGGEFFISSMEDGIHSLNCEIKNAEISIDTDEDGIHAENYADLDAKITVYKSYKGVKALKLTAKSLIVVSFSDSIDCPDVEINGGESILFEKVDTGLNGRFVVNNGTVVVISSNNTPSLPTNSISKVSATVSKPQLATYNKYVKIYGGSINLTAKLSKSYTKKMSVSVISDSLTVGEYSVQIGDHSGFDGLYTYDTNLTNAYTQKLIK